MHEKVLELARRRLGRSKPRRVLDLLRQPGAGSFGIGIPESWNEGVRTFYELLENGVRGRRCRGTACSYARGELEDSPAIPSLHPSVRCLGRCFEGPADVPVPTYIPRRALTATPIVLRHLLGASSDEWADYRLPDGPAILEAIEAWGLRGRGGAAYPTAAKWKVARDTAADDRIVVANGDEGDPGAFVDRLLLEEAPHSVLAGMLACARAIGAGRGIVYIRAEYPVAADRMRVAIAEARQQNVLAGFDVSVLVGAGSYVAGEETALLRSIEGLRAEPMPKPPYPASRGLCGLPTIVQNVETLSIVPWIARARGVDGTVDCDGGDSGVGDSGVERGVARPTRVDTKAVCLSGAIARPGVVEVDLGTPLRRVLEQGGGGPASGKRWKMALVGGPLGRVVAEADFDVPLSFEALPGMGHAGVVVFGQSVSARALAEHLFEFARGESCGACAPCRIGTAQLAACRSHDSLDRLLTTIEDGSLCGFGQGVPRPIRDLLAAFGEEVLA